MNRSPYVKEYSVLFCKHGDGPVEVKAIVVPSTNRPDAILRASEQVPRTFQFVSTRIVTDA